LAHLSSFFLRLRKVCVPYTSATSQCRLNLCMVHKLSKISKKVLDKRTEVWYNRNW
jgi:hypothetical protein